MEVRDEFHAPAGSPLGKNTDIHWAGGWECTRPGLDVMEKKKIPQTDQLAAQWLCQLRYPGPRCVSKLLASIQVR